MGWRHWHQMDHMQIICTSLQTDDTYLTTLFFSQAGCPSCHPTNSVKALKAVEWNHLTIWGRWEAALGWTWRPGGGWRGTNTMLDGWCCCCGGGWCTASTGGDDTGGDIIAALHSTTSEHQHFTLIVRIILLNVSVTVSETNAGTWDLSNSLLARQQLSFICSDKWF